MDSKEQQQQPPQPPKRFTSKAEITPVNPFEVHNSSTAKSSSEHQPAPLNNNSSSNNINNTNNNNSNAATTASCKSTPPNIRRIPITTDQSFGSGGQRFASPVRNMSQFVNTTNSGRTQPEHEYQSPRTGRKVHYIPIFVEGSKEPVLPKNVSADEVPIAAQPELHQTTYAAAPSAESTAPKRPSSDACSFGSGGSSGGGGYFVQTPSSCASARPANQSTTPFGYEREVPIQIETPVSVASSAAAQSQAAPSSSSAQTQQQPAPAVPTKPDPLKQVQAVQQEVDELTRRVAQFSGASRADKEYLYLDEMLTRNLIKLDTIEVAGNEELRVARKNVIKCIQQAIALLESKVPAKTEANDECSDVSSMQTPSTESSAAGSGVAESNTIVSSSLAKNDITGANENTTPNNCAVVSSAGQASTETNAGAVDDATAATQKTTT